jgi:hypothetical protein
MLVALLCASVVPSNAGGTNSSPAGTPKGNILAPDLEISPEPECCEKRHLKSDGEIQCLHTLLVDKGVCPNSWKNKRQGVRGEGV